MLFPWGLALSQGEVGVVSEVLKSMGEGGGGCTGRQGPGGGGHSRGLAEIWRARSEGLASGQVPSLTGAGMGSQRVPDRVRIWKLLREHRMDRRTVMEAGTTNSRSNTSIY